MGIALPEQQHFFAIVSISRSIVIAHQKRSVSNRYSPAKKSLGQHFLVDRRTLGQIVKAAELTPDDVVIEVGPGRGVLTRVLADQVGRVAAIEMDEVLAKQLNETFRERPSVEVVAADAREVDIDSLVEGNTQYKMVANLPYYAASPIVRRFLEAEHKPTLIIVMIQREVAQGMVAQPGKMGLLSVAIQLYGRPRIVRYVLPRAFSPAPKVMSAIVRIDVYPGPVVRFDSEERFFCLVRAGFSSPRKQLRNSLSRGLDISSRSADAMLMRADIDPTRRAQTLSLSEWEGLYEAL